MANRTVKDASSIHGTNPQYLVEKIIRTRIYDSKYWKEECFALTAELLVDKAMALRFLGGVYGGNIRPSPFLCLALKMLQIQPEKDIVIEFIKQDEFKYVRALGCFYLRLVHSSLDCYKYLGPLLNDYRKLRIMDRNGVFQLTYMDQFIDNLLREERYCDVIMPRIQKRWVHEANNELDPRVSLLEDDLDDLESDSEDDEDIPLPPSPPPPHHRAERSRYSPGVRDKRRHSASPSPETLHKRRRDQRDQRDRGGRDDLREPRRHRDARGERDRDRDRERDRDRDRERERGDRGGDHYYPTDAYSQDYHHDYHHGSAHEYHHGGVAPTTTDYHHRRPHYHHSNGGPPPMPPPLMGPDYHHHHRDHHQHGDEGHHPRDDVHHHRTEDTHHTRGDDHHHRSSRREHKKDEGRKEDRRREGREGREGKEGRRKEGRSGKRDEGGSLQAEIDEANDLRAQLGLPPLK